VEPGKIEAGMGKQKSLNNILFSMITSKSSVHVEFMSFVLFVLHGPFVGFIFFPNLIYSGMEL